MTTAGGALRYARLRAPPALSEQDSRCATVRDSPRMRSSPGRRITKSAGITSRRESQ